MPIAQLISPQQLAARLEQPGLVILDCRFALEDPDYGQRSYAGGIWPARILPIWNATSVAGWSRA